MTIFLHVVQLDWGQTATVTDCQIGDRSRDETKLEADGGAPHF